MPDRKQPATLLALCHGSAASHLASTCRMLQVAAQESPAAQVLALARRRLRPRYLSALPGSIRTELLERASRLLSAPAPDGGAAAGSGPAPLYLLALLLAPDVKQLRVELCCYYGCSHQAALLRLLAAEGSGLRSLELARSALLRLDRNLLKDALTSATQLRKLVLRNIAGDAVLQVVGACCPMLEVLDVSHSRQVTDAGIRGLLVNVELTDKQGELVQPPPATWTKLKLLARIVPWLRGDGKKDQRVLLQYCERSTSLCRTLLTLDVANTSVTSGGILLALHHVPSLQSLGEYAHTGRAFEVLEKARSATSGDNTNLSDPKPNTFRLTSARTCRTTARRLELLARCCPSLNTLVMVEPRLPSHALLLLPENLTTLGLRAVPPDSSLIGVLYIYLKMNGATLNEFSLTFANPQQTSHHDELSLVVRVDLAQIVRACPRLRILSVDNAIVEWGNTKQEDQFTLPLLRTVQLGRMVSAGVIASLLPRAQELKILHLHSSPDLSAHHLSYVAKHAQNLECFYVYEARHITSAAAVNALLSSCKHLVRVGNLANWGLDCDGSRAVHSVIRANNLHLELHSGAHWFSSPCVRGLS